MSVVESFVRRHGEAVRRQKLQEPGGTGGGRNSSTTDLTAILFPISGVIEVTRRHKRSCALVGVPTTEGRTPFLNQFRTVHSGEQLPIKWFGSHSVQGNGLNGSGVPVR